MHMLDILCIFTTKDRIPTTGRSYVCRTGCGSCNDGKRTPDKQLSTGRIQLDGK